jgi:hypothetical protein
MSLVVSLPTCGQGVHAEALADLRWEGAVLVTLGRDQQVKVERAGGPAGLAAT